MKADRIKIIGGAIALLVLGYFIGREHLKYEIRQGLMKAFSGFTESIDSQAGSSLSGVRRESLGSIDSTEDSEQEPLPMGTAFESDSFTVRVVGAVIDRPRVRDWGEDKLASNRHLMIHLQIKNLDDRRQLSVRSESVFGGSPFYLQDDVQNSVRRVSFGTGTSVIGSFEGKIDPLVGETVIGCFEQPLPKTESLELTVDLDDLLGKKGKVRFSIPVEAIEGFNRG